jgi:hypothetical protein
MYSIFIIMALVYHNWIMFGNIFRRWKPKGSMYSLKCAQCGKGFLSSLKLEAPICGKCLQKVKSLDSTVDQDKKCSNCGKNGVLYGKNMCSQCYFGFSNHTEGKEQGTRIQ